MSKLTKTLVDAAEARASGAYYVWDDAVSGFGVKVLPSGSKRYLVKYRGQGGGRGAPQRWLSLGLHGQLTCEQARLMAKQVLFAVASGKDPQSEKFIQRQAPKVQDLWERFEVDYLPMRKPQTRKDYESEWRRIIAPKLASCAVSDVTRTDMDKLHKSLRERPYRANRVLALCSRLMTLAEAWGWRSQGSNPCRYVQKFEERARARYLSQEELRNVGTALRQLVDAGDVGASAANALRMLLFTGARLNEVLTAKWEWVVWDRSLIALPDSKTGAKPIYLSNGAIDVLVQQRELTKESGSVYIFPGRSKGHMINLTKVWKRVCQSAEIEDVRLHDLRHTAASIAVGQGASLPIIGRLLGHSQAQTTLRYAHVDSDPALQAANLISDVLNKHWNHEPATHDVM